MKVRFPSGLVVHYPEAVQVSYEKGGYWRLWRSKKMVSSNWLATVQGSAGVIVENDDAVTK